MVKSIQTHWWNKIDVAGQRHSYNKLITMNLSGAGKSLPQLEAVSCV